MHTHLQRSSGQQQATRRVEVQQGLPLLRAEVLDVLRLVEHQVLPRLATEHLLVGDHDVVRGDHDVEGVLLVPPLAFGLYARQTETKFTCSSTSCGSFFAHLNRHRRGHLHFLRRRDGHKEVHKILCEPLKSETTWLVCE